MARGRLGRRTIGRPEADYVRSLEDLQRLRRFSGDPAQFWPAYLRILTAMSEAANGLIVKRDDKREPPWRILAAAPRSLGAGSAAGSLLAQLDGLAGSCLKAGAAQAEQDGEQVLAVRLTTGAGQEDCLAVLFLKSGTRLEAIEKLKRLQLVSDAPYGYQLQRIAVESKTQVEHFASVMDLMVLINAEKRFLAAAMIFANELASRHDCERVSLGWLHKGYVRVQVISHVDHFDRKTEAVQLLEAAMEEALDQNTEVVLSEQHVGAMIGRDHQAFARANDVSQICSLPLRVDEEPAAVCTCERSSSAFSETELRLLRLSCDQAARRLADLKRYDRWLGARLAASLREKVGRLLGYEHTGAKVIVIIAAVLLGIAVFGRFPYRVKAPVILRTDDVAYLTAPFDGHIDRVLVRVGDEVAEADELLSLDQTDLRLREAELIAEKNRYLAEFEKARGGNAPADMRITQALYDQAEARHALVRYQLRQSVLNAPFAGVIVEGDLTEHIGSPVRQGDMLFKLARIDRLYAELDLNETDIHQVEGTLEGEIALASRPQETHGIRVFRMEPVAVPREEGNVFIVHASFPGGPQEWWRPGMTGIAKIDIGERSLIWLMSHRTVDFLRLRLWW
jgi:hypothetical protein